MYTHKHTHTHICIYVQCTYKHMSGNKWNYTAFRGSGKVYVYVCMYVCMQFAQEPAFMQFAQEPAFKDTLRRSAFQEICVCMSVTALVYT